MSQVIFTIDQKDYPIGCPENQKDRLEKLAQLVSKKETEVVDIMGAGISHEMLLVMIIVSLADELERLKTETPNNTITQKEDLSPINNEIKGIIDFVKTLKGNV
ncbi:MAG: cell division protein ZapA [Alphaproteobacteria bacterium]